MLAEIVEELDRGTAACADIINMEDNQREYVVDLVGDAFWFGVREAVKAIITICRREDMTPATIAAIEAVVAEIPEAEDCE